MIKICAVCHVSFSSITSQKFCSDSCRESWNLQIKKVKHDGRKCACGKPVKQNMFDGVRNKGYYRTCGEEECVYRGSRSIRAIKARLSSLTVRLCKHCDKEYKPTSACQKWCMVCVPTAESQARMHRYKISEPEYLEMLREQNNLCALCNDKFPRCVDHDHVTNKVRKLLCDGCNHVLPWVENSAWLEKALTYVSIFKSEAATLS